MSGNHRARLARLAVAYQARQPARRDLGRFNYLGNLTPEEQYELYLLLTILDPDGPESPRPWTVRERLRAEELDEKARRAG